MTLIVAVCLLLAFLFVSNRRVSLSFVYILLIAIIIRLVVTFLFASITNHDTLAHVRVGERILTRRDVYNVDGGWISPFLPFSQYIDAIAVALSSYGIDAMLSIKLFYTVFDIGILLIIAARSKVNSTHALLYALNPLSIQITNIHGQSDIPALFFLLGALLLIERKRELPAYLSLAFGVLWKSWPFLFFAPIFTRTKNKMLIVLPALLALASVLLYVLIFQSSLLHALRPLITYRGNPGAWGVSAILTFFVPSLSAEALKFIKILSNMLIILFFIYSLRIRSRSITKEVLTLILLFFIFTPAFGMQWVTWLVPFLILIKPKFWLILMSLLTIWIGLSQFQWDPSCCVVSRTILLLIIQLGGLTAWLLVIVMFWETRRTRRFS